MLIHNDYYFLLKENKKKKEGAGDSLMEGSNLPPLVG
jgi:hypothetical protein